jgi:glycosyltransferase involved in cell wall biosynthesis
MRVSGLNETGIKAHERNTAEGVGWRSGVTDRPGVSIVVPAYHSEPTIAAALRSFQTQSYPNCEIIVVDSSANDDTAAILKSSFPRVIYHHSPARLLPHAARNFGVGLAASDLLVFTDPDAYAAPDWIEKLVAAYEARGGVITGAAACHGHDWLETGMHLAKFDKWLPGGKTRPTDISPTVNMLIHRDDFVRAGEFQGEFTIGDTLLSWRLRQCGVRLWFAPASVIRHHHTGSWAEFLKEMYNRGREFGHARIAVENWSSGRVGFFLLVSLLPIRLPRLLGRVLGNAARAGLALDYVRTFPVIASGHAARLAGEAAAYLDHLFSSLRKPPCAF